MAIGKLRAAATAEKLREFDRVAVLLGMPLTERVAILNVPEDAYLAMKAGKSVAYHLVPDEFKRRLSYALPLMRRLAQNSQVVQFPNGGGLVAA